MTILRDLAKGTMLPDTYARVLTRGLNDFSVAFQASKVIQSNTARFRIPKVTKEASATWVPEGQEIPMDDPEIDELIITPEKIAGISSASREMVRDSNQAVDQLFSNSLLDSLISAVDGAFFIDRNAVTGDPLMPGIDFQDGIQQVDAGTAWENLDPFAEAISLASAQGATTTSFVANPATILALQKLKTATGANTPLLGTDAAQPTRRTILGVPVLPYRGVANGTVFAIAQEYSYVIQREQFEFETSEHYMFSADKVAFKALTRVGFGFPFPEAHVRVTLAQG